MTVRIRRFAALLAAAAVACMSATAGAQSPGSGDLPDIGSSADATLTREEEYQIGRMVMRGLRDEGQILEDPEINDYIQNIGSRIAAQAQEGGQPFTFFVVKDGGINAFALPGGFIGVNHGLILATANEAQLASVLAHEIAHVTQRHIARSIRAQGRQSLASAAAILAAILIGATTGAADVAQAGIAIAQGTAAQQRINFTRANEYEADRVGIGFLSAAGFDPNSMADFFETLGRRAGMSTTTRVPEFLQTHPVSTNRIAEARGRAAQAPVVVRAEEPAYRLVRERIRVLTAPVDGDVRPYYAARRERGPLTPAERYGEALAQVAAGNPSAAASTLVEVSAANASSPMLQAALGQALAAAGEPDRALQTFEQGLAIAPRNVPLTVRYAELLMQLDRPKDAHAVLLDLFNNVTPTPEQIRQTAMAASAAGDTGDAYYYMSEYHIASGDLILAVKQLELALAVPNLSGVQRARFQARMDEIRKVLADSGRRRGR
jgi:predicted Zn-dependent protease